MVEKEYVKKKAKFEKAAACLSCGNNWQELQNKIKPGLVPPQKLKNCLALANAAHRYSDIMDHGQPLQREKFIQVVLNANQMRERFTILDLALLLGVLPAELDDLVGKWVS